VRLGRLTVDVPHLPPNRQVADGILLAEVTEAIARLKRSGEYDRLRCREPMPTLPFVLRR
jgi:hypothetical protein